VDDLPFRKSQAKQVPAGTPLILQDNFWEEEDEAPVLRRNHGFLKPPADGGSEEALARAAKWLDLCGAQDEEPSDEGCEDPAALRIFERDAERTFMTEARREAMIGALRAFWPENKDYHQGLGYAYSVARLVLDERSTLRLLLRLNRSERHLRGYWFAAPQAYVRDAMVYARLVEEHFPPLHALLTGAGIAAEAYVSKWFVGLALHVLPFRALFAFWDAVLAEGSAFLFKFAMSLLQHTQARLLECPPTDASAIFAILRLDKGLFPDSDPVHDAIVEGAHKWDLDPARIEALRAEEQAKLDAKMARVRAAEQDLGDDDDSEIEFSDEEEDEDPEERLRRLAAAH